MNDIMETARQYWRNYSILGRAHYIAWERADRKNKWLGIPVVVTTTIVGTAIFGSIQEDPAIGWRVAAGLLSLSAAVLSALQTTLKYSESALQEIMAEVSKLAQESPSLPDTVYSQAEREFKSADKSTATMETAVG